MSFLLCRLFRRPKPHSTSDLGLQGSKQGAGSKLHRSATAHADVVTPRASFDSEEDDECPDIVLTGPSSAPETLTYRRTMFGDAYVGDHMGSRRTAHELTRSRTVLSGNQRDHAAASARASMSSDGVSIDDRLRQQYSKIKKFHAGRSSTILHGTDRHTRRPVVIKAYSKQSQSSATQHKVQQEQAVLKATAGCNGIVKLLNLVDDVTTTYLILENVPGFTLIELMANSGGRLPESRAVVEVVFPLLHALAALHALGVVHRDLKPEHVMCTYGNVKLVDFSESALLAQRCLNDRVGQLEYMAPEVLNKPTSDEIFHRVLYEGMAECELPQYNEKADVWSAGVLVYEALTGMQPFMAESSEELAELHQDLATRMGPDGLPARLDHPHLTPLARQFVASMLQLDPAKRPSAEELLKHPWIEKHVKSQQAGWLLPPSISSPHVAPEGFLSSLVDSHLLDVPTSKPPGSPGIVDLVLKDVPVPVR